MNNMSEGVGEGEDRGDTLLREHFGGAPSEPRHNRGSEVNQGRNRRTNGRSQYRFKTSSGRTSNDAEVAVVSDLETNGWTVYKSGWPDLLAVKDGIVRLIEVKPHSGCNLSRRQRNMAEALQTHLGVTVELVTP